MGVVSNKQVPGVVVTFRRSSAGPADSGAMGCDAPTRRRLKEGRRGRILAGVLRLSGYPDELMLSPI
jgi:hypothetical protein